MNWYKISQQKVFDFWDEDKRSQYPDNRPENLLPVLQLNDMSFNEAVEECKSIPELINILKFYADDYDFIDFPNKVKIVTVIINGELQLITISGNLFEVEDPNEWLQNIAYQYPGYASDPFIKRAFLFIIEMNRRMRWFKKDIHKIPVPTDYQIPKMLRYYNILSFFLYPILSASSFAFFRIGILFFILSSSTISSPQLLQCVMW